MIKTHLKAELKDQESINDVQLEINFDPKRKDLIKISLANKVSVIKKDELWHFIFSIVSAEKQFKMMPVVKQEMIQYVKQHTVILQKDMKKGETMAVNCKVNVKQEVVDAVFRELEEEEGLSTPSPYLTQGKNE